MDGLIKLNRRNLQQGYTIVELLVVVGILSILAVFSVAVYGNSQGKVKVNYAIEKLIQIDGYMAQQGLKTGGYGGIELPTEYQTITYAGEAIYTVTLKDLSVRRYTIIAKKTKDDVDVAGCDELTLTHLGGKSSSKLDSTSGRDECWELQ